MAFKKVTPVFYPTLLGRKQGISFWKEKNVSVKNTSKVLLSQKKIFRDRRAFASTDGNESSLGFIDINDVFFTGSDQLLKATPLHNYITDMVATNLRSQKEKTGCKKCVIGREFAWSPKAGTTYIPDVAVFCTSERLDFKKDIPVTPVMIGEILLDGNKGKDLVDRVDIYRLAGVKYYLIIHPVVSKGVLYQLHYGKKGKKTVNTYQQILDPNVELIFDNDCIIKVKDFWDGLLISFAEMSVYAGDWFDEDIEDGLVK